MLELPLSRSLAGATLEAQYMFFSTYHWLPLINGYTGHPPREHYDRIRDLVARIPADAAISELVSSTGLRWIVIHDAPLRYLHVRNWAPSPRLKQIGDFGGMYLIEVLP